MFRQAADWLPRKQKKGREKLNIQVPVVYPREIVGCDVVYQFMIKKIPSIIVEGIHGFGIGNRNPAPSLEGEMDILKENCPAKALKWHHVEHVWISMTASCRFLFWPTRVSAPTAFPRASVVVDSGPVTLSSLINWKIRDLLIWVISIFIFEK